MDKQEKLAQLRHKLEKNASKLPLAKTAKDTVPGEGNPNAQIMFIGEAAGYHESVQRRPFVGSAGKLLTKSLQEISIPRKNVYISNILKVRPPENRDPLPEEIEAFRPYLDAEINIIKPKIIVTLGRFSMAKFIADAKISLIHGQPRWVDFAAKKILIMPLYHPAAALRNGFVMSRWQADFARLPRLLQMIKDKTNTAVSAINLEQEKQAKKVADQQLSLI